MTTGPTADPGTPGPSPARRGRHFLRELPFLGLGAFVLALLLKTFLVQAFYIPSGAMQQTPELQDRVLVNKLVYRFRDIHRGEIVVFNGLDSFTPETAPADAARRGRADRCLCESRLHRHRTAAWPGCRKASGLPGASLLENTPATTFIRLAPGAGQLPAAVTLVKEALAWRATMPDTRGDGSRSPPVSMTKLPRCQLHHAGRLLLSPSDRW